MRTRKLRILSRQGFILRSGERMILRRPQPKDRACRIGSITFKPGHKVLNREFYFARYEIPVGVRYTVFDPPRKTQPVTIYLTPSMTTKPLRPQDYSLNTLQHWNGNLRNIRMIEGRNA